MGDTRLRSEVSFNLGLDRKGDRGIRLWEKKKENQLVRFKDQGSTLKGKRILCKRTMKIGQGWQTY